MAFLDAKAARVRRKGVKKRGTSMLVVRTHLRPVDVYAYLRARFGQPNGLQNFLRKDDSDNLVHWDFNLKAGDADVYLSGSSRDVRILVSEPLKDREWKELILGIKTDFARIGRAKTTMLRSFEKFLVFQNKYEALAELCSELYAAIAEAPAAPVELPGRMRSKRAMTRYRAALDRASKRARALYGNCLKLRLLTPIMAEAYINMLILTFCKREVRDDKQAFDAFVRAKIPERLALLTENCVGFMQKVDRRSESYRNFLRVMNGRNFALHGNMDPVREQIEIVYFEGKRPLFVENGDNVVKAFHHMERINAPEDVLRDYEDVHVFLYELAQLLHPRNRRFFEQVIDDPRPGYEVHKKGVTRILPDHLVSGYMQGERYDDDLRVEWPAYEGG